MVSKAELVLIPYSIRSPLLVAVVEGDMAAVEVPAVLVAVARQLAQLEHLEALLDKDMLVLPVMA